MPARLPDSAVSHRRQTSALYSQVIAVASPGDVVFFISDVGPGTTFSLPTRIYRRWLGFAPEDSTMWHTAIYAGPVKERRSRRVRPHIIHARLGGVVDEHLPPSFFTSVRSDSGALVQSARIEILHHRDLSDDQRQTVVAYCRSQLGRPFDELGWRYDLLTYAFGLPCPLRDTKKVSCHGLAFDAYEQAGVSFPHHLQHMPFYNLARYVGHPLGHPADHADLRRLYLRDHHLYQDSRFACVVAMSDDAATDQVHVVEHPGKYSWSAALQAAYADCLAFGG